MLEKYFSNSDQKNIEEKSPDVFEISFARKHRIENAQLLEIYSQIDLEKIRHQSVGEKLSLHLKLLSHFIFENEIDDYIDVSRRILNFEQSVQKFHNEFKWRKTLSELDKKRHQIHLDIQNIIQKLLMQENNSLENSPNKDQKCDDPAKIRILAELFIGVKIAGTSIWLTRLLPNEKVVIVTPRNSAHIHLREFNYVSDWHDEGNLYKQVYIDFNPLKHERKDIKFEIINC